MNDRMSLLHCLERKCSMPPEIEEGNVEYKVISRDCWTSQYWWSVVENQARDGAAPPQPNEPVKVAINRACRVLLRDWVRIPSLF